MGFLEKSFKQCIERNVRKNNFVTKTKICKLSLKRYCSRRKISKNISEVLKEKKYFSGHSKKLAVSLPNY